jgi:hypothetical protein
VGFGRAASTRLFNYAHSYAEQGAARLPLPIAVLLLLPARFIISRENHPFCEKSSTEQYAEPNLFGKLSTFFSFFKLFTLVLIDGFLDGFSKFRLIIVEIALLAEHTQKVFHRRLSIRGNDFISG